MSEVMENLGLTKKDFTPEAEPRWCPGCGDYAILNTIQKVFPELGVPREKFVVVSGIGCSSRFPYYMNTYGFHTLHGRAPTVATGIKTANPDLSVWMVTGDGDGLSIGGNHLMHVLRRNPDIKIMLFNNRIYGLTKGQYSPTSEMGKVTKSSPLGSVETPINPLSFAIASQATFVARTLDNNPKHMTEVFKAAAAHKGLAFIEIFQNCVIFNNKTFDPVYGRENKSEQLLFLESGKPMVYGVESDKGIVLNGTEPSIINIKDREPIVHNAQNSNPGYSFALAQMCYPEFPTPVGVFRSIQKPTFEESIHSQIKYVKETKGEGQLDQLILGSDYWEVKDDGEREVITSGAYDNAALQEERTITKERSMAAELYRRDPVAKVFQTRLEQILHTYGSAHCITASQETALSEVLMLMKRNNVSSIVITENNNICGILTERDVLFKVVNKIEHLERTPVSEVMTEMPVSAASWETVAQALHTLGEGGHRHLPVTREGGAIGMITSKGVMHFLHRQVLNN